MLMQDDKFDDKTDNEAALYSKERRKKNQIQCYNCK